MGLGDPTHYPLHSSPPAAITATKRVLEAGTSNGYVNGTGSTEARLAIADYHARWDKVHYEVDDVVLTHGVGQALDIVFSVLVPHASAGPSNVLLPRPGFSQYSTLLANLGTEIRYYDCLEEQDWEIDLRTLEAQCDEHTRAIVITNPSNPCGSNYSSEHLSRVLEVADRHKVPVIADEIYGHMTWSTYTPLASLSNSVPIITLSGLSKRFLLPGWRVGWACLHDPLGVASDIRDGLTVWGNRFFGPNSMVQAALPEILQTPAQWFDEVTEKIRVNAEIVTSGLRDIDGLRANMPKGAMYMLIRIEPGAFDFGDEVDFCAALYNEEAVFVLPGMCFSAPGYVRFVLGTPEEVTRDVMTRLEAFCKRHRCGNGY